MAQARRSVAIGAFLVVALLTSCLWIGGQRYRAGENLLARGLRTEATVVSLHRYRRALDIRVTYAVGVRTYESEINVGLDPHRRLASGDKVTVLYLPEDPSVAAVDPARLRDNGRELLVLALPSALVLGTITVGGGLWRLRRAQS